MRSGIAPSLLLDVQTAAGDLYYWADRKVTAVPVLAATMPATDVVSYVPWLLGKGKLSVNRSLQTDTGSITVQNLGGNSFERDFARIMRRSTLEGALFVLRYFDVAAGFAWVEQHGTLTVGDTGNTATLQLQQLLSGSDDTPEQNVSETCQIVWGEKRCGATGTTECLYTYASCQVPEHFVGIQTAYETNNPATAAELPTQVTNRKRAW